MPSFHETSTCYCVNGASFEQIFSRRPIENATYEFSVKFILFCCNTFQNHEENLIFILFISHFIRKYNLYFVCGFNLNPPSVAIWYRLPKLRF